MLTGRKIFSFLIIALFLFIASPLFIPVAFGAIFAVLFFPAFEFLQRKKLRSSLAAALISLFVTHVFLLPSAFLIFIGARAGLQQVGGLRDVPGTNSPLGAVHSSFFENLVNTPGLHGILVSFSKSFPVEMEELVHAASDLARGISLRFADFLGELVTRLPVMVMGMVIMVLSIYFFLVDGKKLTYYVRANSVYDSVQTERLIRAFSGMCRSVILATVISGFAQALIFSLVYMGVGLSDVGLVAFLVFLCSFIPLIGSAPMTLGIAIHQLVVNERKSIGVVLLVVAVFVSVIDNVIRPAVLRGSANLHPLLAFVAAFGGLQILGFSGVFLGPIIAGMFVITVENLFIKLEA